MSSIGNQAVVVGIDGSANSDAALDWAVAEATRRSRPLHLFSAGVRHVAGGEAIYNDVELDAVLTRAALSTAEAHLEAAAAHVQVVAPDLAVTVQSAVDRAAGELVDLSARADTIVVGRSGHGPAVSAVLGSVAMQVVTHAECPVVVVHDPTDSATDARADARGVVVGVDGSAVSELALGYAFEQASLRGVHLRVVHAWWTTVPSGLMWDIKAEQVTLEQLALSETLVGWSEKYPDVEVRPSLPLAAPVSALTEAGGRAELLVVGSRGRGGFLSLLLGSVSQGVLQHATCPVAVVRARSGEHAS